MWFLKLLLWAPAFLTAGAFVFLGLAAAVWAADRRSENDE